MLLKALSVVSAAADIITKTATLAFPKVNPKMGRSSLAYFSLRL